MSGLIAKISLKNFMCHDNWGVDFDRDIIFFGGENGAGKSAVLAALSLCFGGSARSTNRGNAIGNFVQRGKNSATVAVTIRNTGKDAFEPEEYGNQITIERTIHAKGGAPFKIRDQHGILSLLLLFSDTIGKVVSDGNQRDILEQIIDRFNIQVSNPCAVLDQDTSKNFLTKSSPTAKYEVCISSILMPY
jgi:chromosome segregation ATPase